MAFEAKPELLDITETPYSDTSIEDYQFHAYQPYTSGEINYNDEIRIPIQDLEASTVPCNSYLYLEGKLEKNDGTVSTKLEFVNNAIAFLFKEIRYELNGTVINSVRDVGLASRLKGYLSFGESDRTFLKNAGWFPKKVKIIQTKIIIDANGKFISYTYETFIGIFEDFRKLMIHVMQELVLVRNSSDNDAISSIDGTEKPKVT